MFCSCLVHDEHQQTGREGSSESEVRGGQEEVCVCFYICGIMHCAVCCICALIMLTYQLTSQCGWRLSGWSVKCKINCWLNWIHISSLRFLLYILHISVLHIFLLASSGSPPSRFRSPNWTARLGRGCWTRSETVSSSSTRRRSCWRSCSTSDLGNAWSPTMPRSWKRRRNVWRETCRQPETTRARLWLRGGNLHSFNTEQ